jgi:glycosyltransferase involved in cell wall biosynthesis
MKILFFADSLVAGGQERRLLELIRYYKENTDHEMALVITEDEIFYEYAHNLGIQIEVIKRKGLKYDPRLFVLFYRFCRQFKPDVIHTWGKMPTFYAIPTKLICRVPLVSSLIADSKRNFNNFSFDYFFLKANILFSDVILSNSKAGLYAYNIKTPKAKVILNGVNLERFNKEYNSNWVRENLEIKAKFIVVMVARFFLAKDYDLFLDVAKELREIRNDVTFVGIGDGPEWERINQRIIDEQIECVILTGARNDVESIISVSDIGVLFTDVKHHGEGISNSIIEYMALGKPVITTDIFGGSKEIVLEGESGYCVDRSSKKISALINNLLNDVVLRTSMGKKCKEIIYSRFSIERMGKEFEIVYNAVFTNDI